MKSITDATWKDAAVIEAKSLQQRLDDLTATMKAGQPFAPDVVERIARQAGRLVTTIESIKEVTKKPRPTTPRKTAVLS